MDAGLAFSTIVIFFALILPKLTPPQWWGNTGKSLLYFGLTRPLIRVLTLAVVSTTLDAQDAAIQTVLTNGTFGPARW